MLRSRQMRRVFFATLAGLLLAACRGPAAPPTPAAMPSRSETAHAFDAMAAARQRYLTGQLRAMLARLDLLAGVKRPFDEESKLLYDAVAPHHDAAHFQKLLDAMAAELPGPLEAPLVDRFESFQKAFI